MTSYQSRRIVLIDEIRGAAIVAMVLFHTFYDVIALSPLPNSILAHPLVTIASSLIGGTFIFLAGISSNFSRSNLKRGFLLFAVAIGISLVTFFFMPSEFIAFGVLHLLSICMIIRAFAARMLKKISPLAGFFIGLLLFAATYLVPSGYLGFLWIRLLALPGFLYRFSFLFPIGLPGPFFWSADYYPLIPWLFIFFAGAFIGSTLQKAVLPEWIIRHRPTWRSVLGKRSLLIYILHQPIIYGVFYLIFQVVFKA